MPAVQLNQDVHGQLLQEQEQLQLLVNVQLIPVQHIKQQIVFALISWTGLKLYNKFVK